MKTDWHGIENPAMGVDDGLLLRALGRSANMRRSGVRGKRVPVGGNYG
jgi:hypothetical protein